MTAESRNCAGALPSEIPVRRMQDDGIVGGPDGREIPAQRKALAKSRSLTGANFCWILRDETANKFPTACANWICGHDLPALLRTAIHIKLIGGMTKIIMKIQRESKGIKSVEVGYRVLLAVQRGPGAVQLSDIARRSGLSTGAVHNYISSLVRTGMVEQESRGLYRLGPSAFALSLTSFRQLNGYEILKTEARTLFELTGQNTAVSVWSQGGPVSIFTQRADDLGVVEFRSGLVSVLTTSAGRVFAAYLPEDVTREVIQNALDEAGDATTTPEEVAASARQAVLGRGYAHFYGRDRSAHALASPVWTQDDRIAFVLSLLSSDKRADPEESDAFVTHLVECTERATMLLAGTSASGPQSRLRHAL